MRSFVVIALAVTLACHNNTGPSAVAQKWRSLPVTYSSNSTGAFDSVVGHFAPGSQNQVNALGNAITGVICDGAPGVAAWDSANVIELAIVTRGETCAIGTGPEYWTWTANVTSVPSGTYIAKLLFPDAQGYYVGDSETVVVP